jgi:hypothetical protein
MPDPAKIEGEELAQVHDPANLAAAYQPTALKPKNILVSQIHAR